MAIMASASVSRDQPSCSNTASVITSDTKALATMPLCAARCGLVDCRREEGSKGLPLVAFDESNVRAILQACHPESGSDDGDQQALSQEIEAERKTEETNLIERRRVL